MSNEDIGVTGRISLIFNQRILPLKYLEKFSFFFTLLFSYVIKLNYLLQINSIFSNSELIQCFFLPSVFH